MPSLSDAITEQLGLPVLAEIPLDTEGAVPSPPGEPFLEGVRFVRAGLQWQGQAPPAMAIVSITPSAATLTVARYLARSFAESGRRAITVLAGQQQLLEPLLPLPSGAELPTEKFAEPAEVDDHVRDAAPALAVIYCPLAVATLSAIHSVESAVLLVDEAAGLDAIHHAMAVCDTALTPPIAAAILKKRRPSRIPTRLRRFLPSRFRTA